MADETNPPDESNKPATEKLDQREEEKSHQDREKTVQETLAEVIEERELTLAKSSNACFDKTVV